MFVCQCNFLTRAEITKAVQTLLDEDPWQLIVPTKVYHFMKFRGQCCGCFPDVSDVIVEVTQAHHLKLKNEKT